MNTPFYNQILNLATKKTSRMHLPAHKGNPAALPPFAGLLAFDLTEIDGADDLSCPQDTLKQSEANMSAVFASGATLYSASGCSSCVKAMLTLFVKPGEKVVAPRGCHASAIQAFALIDAHPVWVLPENKTVSPLEIEAALTKSKAKTVYITSPDYYGNIADITSISAICRKYNAYLLVDNAHGAHLKFFKGSRGFSDMHPLTLGADAVADSAHKTLPCLTPAALLHLKNKQLAHFARQALNLYSSTSPSYPVLASLDYAAGLFLENPPNFLAVAKKIINLQQLYGFILTPCEDPLRLCISPLKAGLQPKLVHSALLEACIVPEFYDETNIILMPSPWNTDEDFRKLETFLAQFKQTKPINKAEVGFMLPSLKLSIRQAMFAKKETILAKQAKGRIMASISAPCPPGVPLIMPGEVISKQGVASLVAGGILNVDVVK